MISCSDYDYVEIVCLFHYPVRLTMKNGDVEEGTAKDTVRNADKAECIAIETPSGDKLVVLDTVSVLEVTVDNPHFSRVRFD